MCDCFHLAFPNWHAASSETGGGRRLRGAEPVPEDNSICDEPSQFTEGERPRPQGSSPVDEFPEMEKYMDSDKECDAEHDPHRKSGGGKKSKKSGLGSMFEKRSTLKIQKLKEAHSPESEVIVKTAQDGCAEGLVYGGGGKEGIFIKEVVPESPASKNLKLKEGDQVLSATVYFDNVPYEDAIQILEHAQAYKVKLCLKRKPDTTDTEPIIDSDVIPEDETYTPQMREKGKSKRRSDARISWPKFHTLGKKSQFTRSHSSSEADEQRKLELSPPTSDTESPIKSQDALKGKKKSKIKLSFLKKRGRVGSSEDQDTDTATTGQISGKTLQTHDTSDMISPECLESPSEETPEVYETEDLKEEAEDLQNEQKVTHKMELITIDSTLKTEDLTVALADQGSPSGAKSPDGKKKKKERSELKLKILGKDKSHKKEAKAKASPKRLKTLGASIEIADQPDNVKSEAILSLETNKEQGNEQAPDTITAEPMEIGVPKVELEISDVAVEKKSPKKGEEKAKKTKDQKQKQDSKTFKLPKIGFGDFSTEKDIKKTNVIVEEPTTNIEPPTSDGADAKDDPYERLSKSSLSKAELPKREDIEIPGMEDMSGQTTAKGIKEPKVVYTGHFDEISDPLPISIDVDSVKEAVSKLPGYKLPKVDTSGVPIPDEITVIDANAQRISVKTPTKVIDTKTKHETQFTKFDTTASSSISNTTIKLPRITTDDITSEALIIETKMEKTDKPEDRQNGKDIEIEVYKREDIIIPGKESAIGVDDKKLKRAKKATNSFGITMPDIKIPDFCIDLPKQSISQQKEDNLKGEKTIFLQDVKTSKTETKTAIELQIGGAVSEVKTPEIDGIEYIDSAGSPAEKDGGIKLRGFGVHVDAAMPNADISLPVMTSEVRDSGAKEHISMDVTIDGEEFKTAEKDGHGSKFKMPNLGISMPKVKGPKLDMGLTKQDKDLTFPGDKAEVQVQGVTQTEVSLGNTEVSIQMQKVEAEKSDMEIKTQQTVQKIDGQGNKIKLPEFGMKTPKVKGPQFDLSLSKKDVDVTLPEAKDIDVKPATVEVSIPGANVAVISKNKMDITLPEATAKVELPEAPTVSLDTKFPKSEDDIDGQVSKVKKFGVSMPKVKLPEIDLSLTRKDTDVQLPEAKADIKLPDVELKEPSAKVDIKVPKSKSAEKNVDGSPSKFKMPSLKLPKFGIATPNTGIEISKRGKAITTPETQLKPLEEDLTVEISAPSIDIEGPTLEVKKTQGELDGKGHKFRLPKFGISGPKIKGPEIDLSFAQKEVDLPEVKAEVKVPEVQCAEPDIKVDVKAPDVEIEQQYYEGSPSKFKLPAFKLPKLGFDGQSVSVEAPEMDKDVKIERPDVNIQAEGLGVDITAPSIDIEGPSIDVQTKMDGKGSKFKMPHLGLSMPKVKGPKLDMSLSKKDIDATLPEVEAGVKPLEVDHGKVDVSIPELKTELPDGRVEVKLPHTPEINVEMKPAEFEKEGKFKIPKFGINVPTLKGPDIDLSLSKKDVDVALPQTQVQVNIPEAKLEVKQPEVDIKPLETDVELESRGGRFKMPKFGITMPKVKGPEIDVNFSRKNADMTLPEASAEVKLPDVDLRKTSVDVDIEGPKTEVQLGRLEASPSKFKLPAFKLPTFGASTPKISADVPSKDIHLEGAELKMPKDGLTHDITAQNVAIVGPSLDVKIPETEVVGRESKFKVPKFGISLPKVQGPKTGSPKKGVDAKLPDAEVQIPEGSEIDVKLGRVDVSIPEAKIEAEITKPEVEIVAQESKFKIPKFGISMPKAKGPEFDFSLSKKDKENIQAGAKAEVTLPDVKLKEQSAELEIKAPEIEAQLPSIKESPSKFKMPMFKFPKFGIATPNVSMEVPDVDKDIKTGGADMQISVPSTDIDVPKVEAEVHLPDVEFKGSPGGVVIDQQPSVEVDAKLRKPRFSLPTFSFSKQSVKGPEIDTSLQDVDVAVPEGKVKVTGGDLDIKLPEGEVKVDGEDSKFKLPKFGITMPKIKGPDIDLSLSRKDADVTSPGATAEVKVPDVGLKKPSAEVEVKSPEFKVSKKDTEGSPSKYKMPTFKLPKFGVGMPSASPEKHEINKDLKLDETDINIPEEVLTVDIKGPSIDMKMTETEHEGKGSKFKLPKFGITMPKVKGPDIDLSLSKKDVDVTLPEATAEVKLPDVSLKKPSAEAEVKSPELDVNIQESPSKFKMPTFKLPKFGVSLPSTTVELPETNKDLKIDGGGIKTPEDTVAVAAPNVDIAGPSIEISTAVTEHEGKGSRFKMPSLGFKRPSVDLSLSKKDVNVSLPEAKAEVKLPEIEMKEPSAEIQAPEIKMTTNIEGSPSKYKMPTFKLPKFGIGMPTATVELPESEGDIKIPEKALTVAVPDVDVEGPSIDIKTAENEQELKGSKFKFPKFGVTMPKVTGPEVDLSLSKKDIDVTLPEAKAEVKLPDAELKMPSAKVEIQAPEIKVSTKETDGSPSKFKIPTFKLPKFGVGTPAATVELPDTDKDLKIDGADVKISEEILKVEASAPSIDIEGPSMEISTTVPEHEGKGSRFKMPSLGFKRPSVDLSLSKKDVKVSLPEAKAEVKLPDVELKEPSAEVEIQAPEIKMTAKNTEGSPSKYKMPAFKLPKFGVNMPSATVEIPETNKDLKIDGADTKISEEVLKVEASAPNIDIVVPSMEITTTAAEHEGKGSRFKMPSLGFKRPSVDLSKNDVNVSLPEVKAEIQHPIVEIKKPAEVEIKAPEIKIQTIETEGSPSKFKMPIFKLPKFGVVTPSVELPDTDKNLKIDGADAKIPEEVLTVEIAAPSIDTEGLSKDINIKGTEHEGKGIKFKMPSLGFSVPQVKQSDTDLKKDADVTLPDTKATVKLSGIELKESSAKVEAVAPQVDVQTSNTEGSPSKFKMPAFKLPKFGATTTQVSVEAPNVDKNVKIEGEKLEVSKGQVTVDVTGPSADIKGVSVDLKDRGSEKEGSKFKLPSLGISMPKVKGPEVDVSLSKGDVEGEAKAEVKLPKVEVKDPKDAVAETDTPAAGVEDKQRRPSWTFPKLSFSRGGAKVPDIDINFEIPEVDVSSEDIKAEPCPPDVEVREPSGATSTEDQPAVEIDASPKKYKFSLPRLSFSKSSTKESEVRAELPHLEVSLPEGEVIVTQPGMENKAKLETDHDGTGSQFKLPKFGIALPKAKGPQEEWNVSKKDVEIKLPEVTAQVKLPEVEVKSSTEGKASSAGGSPLKLTGPSIEVKTDVSKGAKTEADLSPEIESIGQTSPSKFRLPSFKMPRLSFQKAKPEDQYVPVETECKEDQEGQEESKSPKMTLTSFGELLKNFDVEFNVPRSDSADGYLETDVLGGKQLEGKEMETKQDVTRSPERTGWFKFPRFGPSSPLEPAKTPEKDQEKKSPGETADETVSPTCSVLSSDAFADVSSAMTSEHVGLSVSSPTKVTVKYSDPTNTTTGLGEGQSNIITSTTRTELISIEPNLPEKITILSSGVSSSSEDTLRLESGKIHVITSNIEATPEAQHAKLLTTYQVQSAGGLPLQLDGNEAASWTFEGSQGSKTTVFERRLVTETSTQSSESKETIVITKQITRMLDSAEHISGETASSVKRLKETVHSEKMKFFDEAEK